MIPRSRMTTATPTPIPAFAAVLRPAGAFMIFDSGGALVADLTDDEPVDAIGAEADTLPAVEVTTEALLELAVVDTAIEALVDAVASLPTVAASVNSREVELQ
jgi:hypothetical protein